MQPRMLAPEHPLKVIPAEVVRIPIPVVDDFVAVGACYIPVDQSVAISPSRILLFVIVKLAHFVCLRVDYGGRYLGLYRSREGGQWRVGNIFNSK